MLVDAGVHEVLARLASGAAARRGERIRVVDVGTGTGAVAIALAIALRRRRVLDAVHIAAVDVSPAGDWSDVRVWYGRTRSLGQRTSPTFGFIYPATARIAGSMATMARR